MGSGGLSITANPKLVNDTLANLLEIEFRTDSLTKLQVQQDFETLRQLGFHQSAYNLLFEPYKYQDLKWNKDSLERTLKQSDKFNLPLVSGRHKMMTEKEAQTANSGLRNWRFSG
jgi:hypothetical protein